jgi:undecaprenyl-diphosphatase
MMPSATTILRHWPNAGQSAVPARQVPLAAIAFAASSLFMLLWADALLHERAFFDAWGLRQAQAALDGAFAEPVFTVVNLLTSSSGAVVAWLIIAVALAASRKWVMLLAVGALPVAGVVNEAIGMLSQHQRPTGDEFIRTVETDAASFPSGHVLGAVMLYGLLFVFAGRIRFVPARWAVRAGAITVVGTVGLARLWEGAHWPSDVLGAYTLGALLLSGTLALYFRAERAWGDLPLIRQGRFAHDEDRPHAHALTSVVVFSQDTVAKIYSPGLLPRLAYAAAFQAPFPYLRNDAALAAAVHRRNLARYLSEYWYGSPRVARAIEVRRIAGRRALVSEFVDGSPPQDRAGARAFLRSLRTHFEEAGLPTWQIDPRQPRAVDNVLETPDRQFMIVDLESGLVAPIASLSSWRRGIRRGAFPLFDEVHFDITRHYVSANESGMRAALGDTRFEAMLDTIDAGEAAQRAWHASEPRLWGRFVGGFWSAWNYRAWPGRLNRLTAAGQERANARLRSAVDAWASEGRVTAREAELMRTQIDGAEMQAIMPHLGAHAALTVLLRFPFGSIARAAWSAGALAIDTLRLLTRRMDRARWKRSWTTHSPVVLVLSLVPGFGAMAYLASAHVRKNRLLMRAVLDSLALKVPFGLYQRLGVRRLVARSPQHSLDAATSTVEAHPCAA